MRALLIALATVLALLGSDAGAGAALASGTDVLDDCTDDEVMSRTYTQKEYRAALSELAADTDQYGNCRDVIRRAQLAALTAKPKGSGGTSRGTGKPADEPDASGAIGSPPVAQQLSSATARERRAVARARADSGTSERIDNATVDPAKAGAEPAISQVSDLPAPLVALLALLLAGALALGAIRIRSLVHARRG